jgi:hypothetical protein
MFANVDSLRANSSLAARIRNRVPRSLLFVPSLLYLSHTIFNDFEPAKDLRHVCCYAVRMVTQPTLWHHVDEACDVNERIL